MRVRFFVEVLVACAQIDTLDSKQEGAHAGLRAEEESTMRPVLGMVCAFVLYQAAPADEFRWSWERGDTQAVAVDDSAGSLLRAKASFNSQTNELSFRVVFRDRVTDGFTLVMSDGGDASGRVGTFAMLYFDATAGMRGKKVRMSAYAYNGKNRRGFRDGDALTPGRQRADLIHRALDRSWIRKAMVAHVGETRRVMKFTIDATRILAHLPRHGDADSWFGTGFGERLGLWLRTFDGLVTRYGKNGRIKRWSRSATGFLDGVDLETERDEMPPPLVVPLPTGAALAVCAIVVLAMRRNRPLAMDAAGIAAT